MQTGLLIWRLRENLKLNASLHFQAHIVQVGGCPRAARSASLRQGDDLSQVQGESSATMTENLSSQ